MYKGFVPKFCMSLVYVFCTVVWMDLSVLALANIYKQGWVSVGSFTLLPCVLCFLYCAFLALRYFLNAMEIANR